MAEGVPRLHSFAARRRCAWLHVGRARA
jgi:hypothetical protein